MARRGANERIPSTNIWLGGGINELTFLRQHASLIHGSYRKLTDEFVTQFKLIDSAVSNLFQPAPSASASPPEQPSVQTPGSDRSSAAA